MKKIKLKKFLIFILNMVFFQKNKFKKKIIIIMTISKNIKYILNIIIVLFFISYLFLIFFFFFFFFIFNIAFTKKKYNKYMVHLI